MCFLLGCRERRAFWCKRSQQREGKPAGDEGNISCYNPFSQSKCLVLTLYFCTLSRQTLNFSLTHTFTTFELIFTPHSCFSQYASELYLAGRKGFVLHGDSAVGSQDCDAQLPLPVQRLLVPLLHRNGLKGRDHCHLETNVHNNEAHLNNVFLVWMNLNVCV